MAKTDNNTKTIEPAQTAPAPETIQSKTPGQAFAEFQTIKILMLVGQPYSGKSLIAQAIYDLANLKDRDDVFAGDCEEGANKVFLRCSPGHIQSTKIETDDDLDQLISDCETDGHKYAILDLQGSAQRPVRNAFGDCRHLARMAVTVVPVILVGTRDGAGRVAKEWVEIFRHLPKIFWIWNNQDAGTTDTRELPEDLPCDRSKIIEIRVPPIRQETAEEIIRLGVPLSQVVARTFEGSQHLLKRSATIEIHDWRNDLQSAFAPIINEFQ